jgi:hypothetical protein
MDLISAIVIVAVVGFAVWLVVTYVPMPAPFKTILIAFVALILVLWLLRIVVGPVVVPIR